MKLNPFNLILGMLRGLSPKNKTQERTDFLKKIMNFVHECKFTSGGDYLEVP